MLGMAIGLLIASLISFLREGTFAFHYASFGGITLLGSLLVLMSDIGRAVAEAAA